MDARYLDELLRAVAERQHGVVARSQARDLGASDQALRRRLASPDWEAVTHRVLRLVGTRQTFEQRCMEAVLDAGRKAVLSHESAGRLWSLPGFEPRSLDVTRRRGGTRRPSALAHVHEPRSLPDGHLASVGGVPVTSVARTLFDLAGVAHPARVERALDNALARRLTTTSAVARITAELAEQGRTGSTLMRRLSAERDVSYIAPESGLEARFLSLLRSAGLPAPARQVDVGGDEWIGRVDFVYRDRKLVIEVDGDLCHTTSLDRAADRRRDEALQAQGFAVLRFTEQQVWHRANDVVAAMRLALGPAAA